MHPHTHYERLTQIETSRLRLRPMRKDDAELVVAWRNAAAPMFFLPPPTLQQHRSWFDGPRRGRVDYMIVRKDEMRPIGVVNFKNIDGRKQRAEAGKLLGDVDSRGQGMAKEAFAGWLLYGFNYLDFREVIIQTRADNSANIHLNRRLGFHIIDQYDREVSDGEYKRFLLMKITYSTSDNLAQIIRKRP